VVLEYSGLATASPLNGHAENTNSGTSYTTGSLTTTNANDLLIGYFASRMDQSWSGLSWTSRFQNNVDFGVLVQDKLVSAKGQYEATATASNSNLGVGAINAFKSASGSMVIGTSYENRLTNGLVGFWTMNGKDYNAASSTAEVLDKSGQGNNADNNGGSLTIGKLGQGLKFNHASGYATAPNTASLRPSNVTVSAWVYLNSTQAAYLVLKDKSLGSSYQLTNSISGTADYFSFCSYVSGSYTCAEAPNIVRDWVHLVGIYDGTNRYLYINGILKSTVPGGAIDYTNSLPLYIGGYTAANYGLDGKIDEVRIYNRALSADEVKQLYKMGQ
jgi:hypothetical protein